MADVRLLNSYTEISPSGKGLRCFAKGQLPDGWRKCGHREIYSEKRYLTITGNHLDGTPLEIFERQSSIEMFHQAHGPTVKNHERTQETEAHTDAENDALLNLMFSERANGFKWRALHEDGDIAGAGYSSASEARMAYLNKLAFYTKKNADWMDELFRLSNLYALNPEKWDRLGGGEIAKAVNGTKAVYTENFHSGASASEDFSAEGAGLRDRLLLPSAALETLDDLPHIVDRWIPQGEVTLFTGYGGSGKSYVSLVLAIHVVLGIPFGPLWTKQSKVLFFSCEDNVRVLRYRLGRICRAMEVNPTELDGKLFLLDASDIDSALHREQRIAFNGQQRLSTQTALLNELQDLRLMLKVRLVVIDNASDSFDGDEIRRAQVRAFIRSLRSQLADQDRAVLLLAHVNKISAIGGNKPGSEDYSGSTAWHNSVRSRLSLVPVGPDTLTIEHMKANLGPKASSVRMVWRSGVPVVVAGDFAMDAEAERMRDESDKDALVELLEDFDRRGERVTTSVHGSATVFRVLSPQPTFPCDMDSSRLMRLLRELRTEGRIFRREVRTADRKKREIFTCKTELEGAPNA
ncbi:MAG: AAA family ATPase [Magnetococcus sp. YQC-9]